MKMPFHEPREPKSLTVTIALAFVTLSVGALLVSAGLQSYSNIRSHQAALSSKQLLVAQEAAIAVSSFVRENFEALNSAIWFTDLYVASPEKKRDILQGLLGFQPSFRRLALLNRGGRVVGEVSRLSQADSRRFSDLGDDDASSQSRRKGKTISSVYLDEATSEPLVIITVPVTTVFGDFQGTLAAEVNLKFMWDLVDQINVGEKGLAYVVDRKGNLLAFDDTGRVLAGENVAQVSAVNEFMRNPVTARSSRVRTYRGVNGSTVVGTYVPLGTPDWAVVTEIPWGEAYRGVIRDVAISLAITLTVALLAGLLGVYLARRLSVPIVSLMQTATRIAEGERGLLAKVSGPQEIAGLATAFNSMTAQLRKSLEDLEQRFVELQRAEAALQLNEERLRLALEGTTDGIWDWNLKTGQVYFSPRYYTMLGYEPDEFPASYETWKMLLHPDDLPAAEKVVQENISQNVGAYSIEFRAKAKNGEWRWILGRGTVVERDREGNAVRLAGSHSDITASKRAAVEKKNLEEQFIQAQKMESVGRLAGGVAHDFNNMLSVILGYAELMKMKMSGDDPLLQNLVEIERAAARSRDITRQLLAFSRKQIIAPQPLNVNNLIVETQKTLARLIGEDINLRFSPGNDLWRVKIDPSQIDQILVNLAVNARDAMPNGGMLTIETSNVHLDEDYCRTNIECIPGNYVLLVVSDNGAGMDKEILSHLFEPFFTTKEAGKGTGLGLATIYGIVKQNNGFITVYSEPRIGTTFKIYLPRIQGEEEATEKRDELPLAKGTGTVLVVEDEGTVRKLVAEMLGAVGYRVIMVGTPQEALSFFEKKDTQIDLLMSDVIMPGMNGMALREKIRAIKPDVKVLFMSGYTSSAIVSHGVLQEGVHFIQKPFSMPALAKKVSEVIGSRQG